MTEEGKILPDETNDLNLTPVKNNSPENPNVNEGIAKSASTKIKPEPDESDIADNLGNETSDTVLDWPNEAIKELLSICQEELHNARSATDVANRLNSLKFWVEVGKKFNEQIPADILQGKFEELKAIWTARQGASSASLPRWPFDQQMRSLLDKSSFTISAKKVKQERLIIESAVEDSDEDDSQLTTKRWTVPECLALINAYKKFMPLIMKQTMHPSKVWKLVLRELGDEYAVKFSHRDLRFKMRQLTNAYTDIVDKGDGDVHSKWPLFSALREMLAEEPSSSKAGKHEAPDQAEAVPEEVDDMDESADNEPNEEREIESNPDCRPENDEDANEEAGVVRWTTGETMQLMNAYKEHLPRIVCGQSYRGKGLVWARIAAEVQMKGRLCTGGLARQRIYTLKKRWDKLHNQKSRRRWPLYNKIDDLIRLEHKLTERYKNNLPLDEPGEPISPDSPEPIEPSTSSEKKELKVKRKFEEVDEDNHSEEEEPAWFSIYRADLKRRHIEKMKIKDKLLSILEEFVLQM